MSIAKIFGAAALLAVLCAPTTSIAAQSTSDIARPVLRAENSCRTYHYRYRAYRPRVRVMPRHYYPRKKKKPLIGF